MLREVFQSWTLLTTFINDISSMGELLESGDFDLVMIHRELIPNDLTSSILQLESLFPDTKVIIFLSEASGYDISEFPQDYISGIIQDNFSAQLIRRMIQGVLDASHLERLNTALQEEVRRKNHEIAELSTTASQLKYKVERTKRDIEQRIFTQIRSLMLPLFEDILNQNRGEVQDDRLQALRNYMHDLASELATPLESNTPLSAQELRVALMVRNGMTSVEIAGRLRVSPETVKTHRRNIRRKFGLTSTNQKLSTYLQALQPLEERPMSACGPEVN
jgi:DNA-binding CsgD family transcriptional regulator